MTYGEAKKVVEEFVAEHKGVEMKDIAQILIDKQEEFGFTDLDLGILLVSIGAEDSLTEGAIKALEKEGFFEGGDGESEETEKSEKEKEVESEKPAEKDEKEEVRKLYSEKDSAGDKEEVEDKEEKVEDKEDSEDKEKEEVRKMYSGD